MVDAVVAGQEQLHIVEDSLYLADLRNLGRMWGNACQVAVEQAKWEKRTVFAAILAHCEWMKVTETRQGFVENFQTPSNEQRQVLVAAQTIDAQSLLVAGHISPLAPAPKLSSSCVLSLAPG